LKQDISKNVYICFSVKAFAIQSLPNNIKRYSRYQEFTRLQSDFYFSFSHSLSLLLRFY